MNLTPGITANGSSEAKAFQGGYFVWSAGGTFGSGTLRLQYNASSGWCDVTDANMTTSGTMYVALPAGEVRVTLSGATSPNIYSDFSKIPALVENLTAKGI